MLSISTSKKSVALGGITLPLPSVPYPNCGGTVSLTLSPTLHQCQALVKAGKHLVNPDLEIKGLFAVPGAGSNSVAVLQRAGVMHDSQSGLFSGLAPFPFCKDSIFSNPTEL